MLAVQCGSNFAMPAQDTTQHQSEDWSNSLECDILIASTLEGTRCHCIRCVPDQALLESDEGHKYHGLISVSGCMIPCCTFVSEGSG